MEVIDKAFEYLADKEKRLYVFLVALSVGISIIVLHLIPIEWLSFMPFTSDDLNTTVIVILLTIIVYLILTLFFFLLKKLSIILSETRMIQYLLFFQKSKTVSRLRELKDM